MALQLLLRPRRLPHTQNAAVAPVSRAQGLSRRDSRADRDHAGRRDRRADATERWREWWRDTFTASPFWQIGRAAFMPPVDHDRLPVSLIERFNGGGGERLIALLRFLAPITGGDRRAR